MMQLFTWCAVLLITTITLIQTEDVDVQTALGTIRGVQETYLDTPLRIFRSIPFAKPPLGELRFLNPQPVEEWEGVLNATEVPNSCMQNADTAFQRFEGVEMWNAYNTSEDCLYLSVWAPVVGDGEPAKDVLVWIFGGGFYSGSSTLDIYDGRVLAVETGMVVVSIQHRVGPQGFIYLDHEQAPGNQGLKDQVMALQWIKDHISDFGGNPDSVTLFGESSGGSSVSYHLISPMSTELFTRAIMQSGTALCRWSGEDPKTSKARNLELVDLVGCNADDSTEDIMACMRDVDGSELATQIWSTTNPYNTITPVMATVDGEFLVEDPHESVKNGNFKDTEILLGSNKDEGSYYIVYLFPDLFNMTEDNPVVVDQQAYRDFIKLMAQDEDPLAGEAVAWAYMTMAGDDGGTEPHKAHVMDDIYGDAEFICPTIGFADAYAMTNHTVYVYNYIHLSTQNPWPEWLGVMHGYEIDVVFGVPLREEDAGYTDEEKTFSRRIIKYWAEFAKTGNPNPTGESRPADWPDYEWPVYTPQGKQHVIMEASGFSTGSHHRQQQCYFWDHYLPGLTKELRKRKDEKPKQCDPPPSAASMVHVGQAVVITALVVALITYV